MHFESFYHSLSLSFKIIPPMYNITSGMCICIVMKAERRERHNENIATLLSSTVFILFNIKYSIASSAYKTL